MNPVHKQLTRLGLVVLLLLVAGSSSAAEKFTIGMLQLQDDPRYTERALFASFLGQSLGRPVAGAEIALREVRFHGAGAGVEFALTPLDAPDLAGLQAQAEALLAQGVRFIIADLPEQPLAQLAKALRDKDLLLFNVSASADSLRGVQCQPGLFHTLPSDAMRADALAQFLVSKKWNRALMLVGESEADQAQAAAFERAAKRYGVKISDRKTFVLGTDPRQREQNNKLLLSGGDYDVVYVADKSGEFARELPYQTRQPRPVIGSEGLAALAWNWAWERHGAPQLERRFEKQHQRKMADTDWAAWMALKAVATAVQQTGKTDFATLRDFLLADDTTLDGFKGMASSFRPWDRQLRQPLLLSTHNWVVARAPIEGFLHQKNNLDTLGADVQDSACKF